MFPISHKQPIAWITDSVACIPKEVAEKMNIHIIPVTIIHDGNVYKDGVDISAEQFYESIDGSSDLSTSQPSLGEFVSFYESLKDEYEIGIAVHISSKLSGTYNTSVQAAEIVGFPLLAIDSKTGVGGMYDLLMQGIKLQESGLNSSGIADTLSKMADKMKALLLIGNLEQFRKSGRLSNRQFFLGNLLNIKPIISVEDGLMLLKQKVRTMRKAEKKVLETIFEKIQNGTIASDIYIAHSACEQRALEWKKTLKEKYPNIKTRISMLSPSLGTHSGKGTIGVFWREK
ncbi:DegV family protein [Bacillus carboniphilus]|uniref:DegV family protein n=1 Tax=Bacillus carboniphilus TaxID=86663 RepID=A0ABY9K0H2_9BACI|nr:DegV family protein [Bacillus carboniphilus]WLR43396.1 DegV family protein [Bacillus carboniphilus]